MFTFRKPMYLNTLEKFICVRSLKIFYLNSLSEMIFLINALINVKPEGGGRGVGQPAGI